MVCDLLGRIAEGLRQAGIPYMVIGGQAVLLYGEPRLTRDIDIILGRPPSSLPCILDVVGKLRLKPLVTPETFVPETWVLPCLDPESGLKVDFVFSDSEYERQAIKRAKEVAIGSFIVAFASLEDVIIHKVIAGRARDLEDVRQLLLKNPTADLRYIRKWLRALATVTDEPLAERFEDLLTQVKLARRKKTDRKGHRSQ
ncbi:MAG: nucleotidyltransferase [Armatimonadetes bacterium]|nr:nucleotidyltransferase [Armatimonadota bacterium]MDW8122443.1 DUF6036 family nucleotidyltransferase [Armatimonadota bacterium]